MTTPQLTKVVRIGTGEVRNAAIEIIPADDRMSLSSWAVYDEQREYKAQIHRDYIEGLQGRIAEAESQLLDLYKEAK